MRRRQSLRGLTNTRIYPKGKRLYLFSATAIENPITGKVAKWHPLCAIADGEAEARRIADAILKHNRTTGNSGDFSDHMETYRLSVLQKREKRRPREAARAKLFEEQNKEITRACSVISTSFKDFDANQVMPVDVAKYVDQWEGQRMAQYYLSKLSDFFSWCCRKGIRNDNPCREVGVEKPAARKRYITHEEFHKVRDAMLTGADGKRTPSGDMVQCYADLCYMLYQRTTEIRLMKWAQIDRDAGVIHFTPTKTERSSGATVDVPITPAVQAVLARAKQIGTIKSLYVIHKLNGDPYQTRGIGTAWVRACSRAGVENATLKDLRAKALTDARAAGYSLPQLKVAAAHTDEAMTDQYIKRREKPRSEVVLELPPKR